MFCVLRYSEPIDEDVKSIESEFSYRADFYNKTLLINPDCYIQILVDYLSDVMQFDKRGDYVLCDEMGDIIEYKQLAPWTYASSILESLNVYYVVKYERSMDGKYIRLKPVLNKRSKEYVELMGRLKVHLVGSKTSSGRKFSKSSSESRKRKGSSKGSLSLSFSPTLSHIKSKPSIRTLKSRDRLRSVR